MGGCTVLDETDATRVDKSQATGHGPAQCTLRPGVCSRASDRALTGSNGSAWGHRASAAAWAEKEEEHTLLSRSGLAACVRRACVLTTSARLLQHSAALCGTLFCETAALVAGPSRRACTATALRLPQQLQKLCALEADAIVAALHRRRSLARPSCLCHAVPARRHSNPPFNLPHPSL